MKKTKEKFIEGRREFIKTSAITASAFTVIPRYVLGGRGFTAPSDKLNIACVGIGGKGRTDAENVKSENIIALCDVDQKRASEDNPRRNLKNAYDAFPKARRYQDFREMFEKENDIDAVMVSTPDHTHAVITMDAMERGKHVYTQKPLTRTVGEARKVTELARKAGIASQMGNQAHADEGPRILNELIWEGTIGRVREVYCWTDRPKWPQGNENDTKHYPIPHTLNWDLWLGPAHYREYRPVYVPTNWRGWWDFGSGALGDMGCHIMDYPFWALKLDAPISIEAYSTQVYQEVTTLASLITYKFNSGLDNSILELKWYDGGLRPNIPEGLKKEYWEDPIMKGGVIFIGDSGVLVYPHKGDKPVLLVNGKQKEYGTPKKMIPRSPGHYKEWIDECKGNKLRAMSNFDYAGPLAETVLLGNVAIRSGEKLMWDAKNLKINNVPEANRFIGEEYRSGWSL